MTASKTKKVFGDVQYEVNMVNATAKALSRKPKAGLKNVLLESFLIHSKNVFEFLTLPGQNGNKEILASHYSPDWSSVSAAKKMPVVSGFIPKMDDYLLHLSYNRLKTKPKWPVGKMLKEINGIWGKFQKSNDR